MRQNSLYLSPLLLLPLFIQYLMRFVCLFFWSIACTEIEIVYISLFFPPHSYSVGDLRVYMFMCTQRCVHSQKWIPYYIFMTAKRAQRFFPFLTALFLFYYSLASFVDFVVLYFNLFTPSFLFFFTFPFFSYINFIRLYSSLCSKL